MIIVPVSRITFIWYLTCILIAAFSLYLCWYGLRYQCYGPDCYQMTKRNTRLSPNFWSTTYSVIGNSIWYDLKNDMIAIFPFPCCFNYHLKLHLFSHEIKSNQNKLKIMGHHLSPSISTLILLNGVYHYVYWIGYNEHRSNFLCIKLHVFNLDLKCCHQLHNRIWL